MTVPVEFAATSIGSVKKLNEANPFFNQPTGEDAVLGKRGFGRVLSIIGTVHFQKVFRLGGEVADFWDR